MESLNDFEAEILKLTLSLYSNFAIPRSEVQSIITHMADFIANTYIPRLEQEILSVIENKSNKNIVDDVKSIFKFYKYPFTFVNSEHQRFQLYKQFYRYSAPQEFIVGYTRVDKVEEKTIIEATEPVYAVYTSLRHTLETFLSIPNILDQLLSYMKKLQDDQVILSNYIQGESWREISRDHVNRLVVPIHIYQDEVEVGNPLGSHAGRNKIGAVYAFIPCLPPHLVSQLNSIFLLTLFYSNDRKIYGNRQIFKKAIDELKDLNKKGIQVTINNEQQIIYFECGLILGDNLGLNGILGFVESFNSGHPCRICLMSIEDIRKSTTEDERLLRNTTNYEQDVKKNDMSKTGIKEECVFNQIKNFHVTKNAAVDIMHDVHEGSGNYVMRKIVYQLVVVDKVFSYNELVYRMETFPYGTLESGNIPPTIKLKYLKENKTLKMSASEMGCFIRYFGLMFGDLVPRDHVIWPLYEALRKIFDIITAPSLLRNDATILKDLVTTYTKLYLEFVGNLTIKSHYLTHYDKLMLRYGPLVHSWSMRCESKNKDIKIPAVTTSSAKNLLVTIAIRDQLKMSYVSISKNFRNDIIKGICEEYDKDKMKYFPNIPMSDIQTLKYIDYSGHRYQLDTVIVVDIDENEGPQFGKIYKIYSVANDVYFVMYHISTIAFDQHYHAWNVQINSCPNYIKKQNLLPHIVPCLLLKKKGLDYVATRHLL